MPIERTNTSLRATWDEPLNELVSKEYQQKLAKILE